VLDEVAEHLPHHRVARRVAQPVTNGDPTR
jgi:hypothetical protein